MATADKDLFELSTGIKASISLMNQVADTRFRLLLRRVVEKLHLKEESAFTPDEEAKLCEVLSLSEQDLGSVLDAASFILQQTAYYAATAKRLQGDLRKAGLDSEHTQVFCVVWQQARKDVLELLSTRSVVPQKLGDVSWQLHLKIGQGSLSRVKEPIALFQLGLDNTDVTGDDKTKKRDQVTVEFTHEQLLSFYDQLETIQTQLDNVVS
eukprot:TRINITY_DN1419_c0_g5_i1.p1 TRINITY_DN1419_c0_g5~~TRINITY_DN1419_c0_g5_i1.p1  ORF type:complete len:210 (-),score=56.82 TRINITY_DN1419_c0_g5_i1:133-762(-)